MMRDEYDPVPPFAATPVDPPAGYGHTLTIDEIVGRLIGYKPQKMPYDEVLDASIEKAGFDLQQAEIAGASADQLEDLRARIVHLGRQRRKAICFDRELKEVAEGRPNEYLILSDKAYPDGLPRFITTSVYNWAKEVAKRDIPEWAPISIDGERAGGKLSTNVRTENDDQRPHGSNLAFWNGLTLDFVAHNKLRISSGSGKVQTVDLDQCGLLNKRTKELNTAGAALLGLATAMSIPKKRAGSTPGISSKVMSQLRDALQGLAQQDTDPFYDYNLADGWKPRFRVRDRRAAAEERSKGRARHVPYRDGEHGNSCPDEYTFESENPQDDAAIFLKENYR